MSGPAGGGATGRRRARGGAARSGTRAPEAAASTARPGGTMADAPPQAMKTYREGERFPGRIGRTYADSEPAFPVPPAAPAGAPNVLYVVIDDIGFGWIAPFGGRIRTPHIDRLAQH